MKKRNKPRYSLLLLLLLFISLGYALLQSNLNINGIAEIEDSKWDIHWDNVQIKEGSVSTSNANKATINSSKTIVSYNITLDKPGDFYEFTVDIANDGSLDALLEDVRNTTSIKVYDSVNDEWNDFSGEESSLKFITHTITGIPAENSVLEPGTANYKNVKVRVDYPQDISATDLPEYDYSITKTIELDYVQNK